MMLHLDIHDASVTSVETALAHHLAPVTLTGVCARVCVCVCACVRACTRRLRVYACRVLVKSGVRLLVFIRHAPRRRAHVCHLVHK